MANRLLTSMLVVIAVLAIGWTTLVLVWDPQPDMHTSLLPEPREPTETQTSETDIRNDTAGDANLPIAAEESVTEQNRVELSEDIPMLDASLGIEEVYRLVSSIGMDADVFQKQFQDFYCGAGWASEVSELSWIGCDLEQPYGQYENDTLQQLAESGDMWAQQFLADRLRRERPAEALAWYQRAAEQGSASAAEQIAGIYYRTRTGFLDQANVTDEKLLEQTLALQDAAESPTTLAAAWAGVSQLIARRSIGTSLGSLGTRLSDEQFQSACELAGQLYDQFATEEIRRVSPFLMTATDSELNQCPGDRWTEPDLSACQSFQMTFGSLSSFAAIPNMQGWICSGE